ncbi:MAG: winged helix-turn-helix domain-containing protein [Planctomycetota bacterium]|jgi:DNA-binding transcriptional ArsR family regulator
MSNEPIYDRIDETIHQRTRLAVMVTLAAVESLEFGELKTQLGLTDGNLSTHGGALERAGYVKITKAFRGKKPLTTLAITAKGRRALTNYVNLLQGILGQAG